MTNLDRADSDVQGSAKPSQDSFPRVEVISRSPHKSHSVHLPFFAIHDFAVYEGISFTLDEMVVYSAASSQEQGATGPTLQMGRIVSLLLRMVLHGFVFEIKVRAKVIARDRRASARTMTLAFCDLAPAQREALRKIMRSYHSGLVASPAEVLEQADDPTFAARESTGTAVGAPAGSGGMVSVPALNMAANSDVGRRRFFNQASLGASVLVILACFGYIGATIYDKVMHMPATYATVTAPRIDLRAAEMGQIDSRFSTPGTKVERDTRLYRIAVATLDSQGIELASEITAMKAAMASAIMPTPTPGPLASPMKLASNEPNALTTTSFSVRTPLRPTIAPAQQAATAPASPELDDATMRLSLLEGQQKALELRQSALNGFSPCDCVIQWFQEDGAWVLAGDLVATLARTEVGDLRIEALVHLTDSNDLHVGQTAVVTVPGSLRRFDAKVERISLDPEQQPRIGFPEWLRKADTLASVLLIPEEPLQAGDIGQPFEVVLRKPLPFERFLGQATP